MAYENGLDAIYTTPLKALSNQKFSELRRVFGSSEVRLSAMGERRDNLVDRILEILLGAGGVSAARISGAQITQERPA